MREIPLDPVLYKRNINSSYAFLSRDAMGKLNHYLQSEDIAKTLGHKTVQVKINVILPLTESNNSYQVRWVETRYSLDTGNKETEPDKKKLPHDMRQSVFILWKQDQFHIVCLIHSLNLKFYKAGFQENSG